MGRNRKPTAVLEASGTFEHDPQRRRARLGEPTVIGTLGEPHESLTDSEKALWRELATQLPPGVAGKSDRWAFEELVRLAYRVRTGEAMLMERRLLLSYLSKFGLTPSDRSKVSAVPGEEQDPLEKFLERKPQ